MKRYLITIAMVIAALALYSAGFVSGSVALFALGAICELWFWTRIFRRPKSL